MALIECPVCQKRISSKAKQCQYCKASADGDSDSKRTISHIQKSNKLMNQMMLFLTLFIAGAVYGFWGGEVATGTDAYIAGSCFAFGFVGYIITRVISLIHKRKSV
ncbi:hypothetical protein BCU94_17825 [Shewanella sp. 10N.286.52.C2]|uniref:zinc ribbon domain-containing protein n=1 Tax=Shewanella sp. 10N.286.52.C2 TaxID=1880838 RepID=UPI000C837B6E|nr:zinc ribbon domain-containing protein [Shewanella sp. 10N.286.52.C2]PMG28541.1 hypothetical protein BCU94_17825 [Shewanella sp. 10N.286.52.C2]